MYVHLEEIFYPLMDLCRERYTLWIKPLALAWVGMVGGVFVAVTYTTVYILQGLILTEDLTKLK